MEAGAPTSALDDGSVLRLAHGQEVRLSSLLDGTVIGTFELGEPHSEVRGDIHSSEGTLLASIRIRALGKAVLAPGVRNDLVLRRDETGEMILVAKHGDRRLAALCTTHQLAEFREGELASRIPKKRSALFVGVVRNGRFVALIQPGWILPAASETVLETIGSDGHRQLFFDVMVVSALDASERLEQLERSGSFAVSAEDMGDVLEFSFAHAWESGGFADQDFRLVVGLDENEKVHARLFDPVTAAELALQFEGDDLDLDFSRLADVTRSWEDRDEQAATVERVSASPIETGIVENTSEPEQEREVDKAPGVSIRGPVFISHRSATDAEFANSLVARLEDLGISCWIAPRDIRSGANWNRAIMAAIRSCRAMVVVVSEGALESDFVQAEVHRALRLGKQVVPLLIADDLPYTDLDARLETRQHVDWYAGELVAFQTLHRSLAHSDM